MFRHGCTVLPYPVQVGRIPDVSAIAQILSMSPRGKVRNLCCIASLKGLRLVHFFRGPLKELANAISGSPQGCALSYAPGYARAFPVFIFA